MGRRGSFGAPDEDHSMFGIVGCQRSCAPASQASSSGIGVFWGVFMPLEAVRGSGQGCGSSSPTPDVFLSRHGFEVSRVYAVAHSAKMVNIQTWRDCANEEGISKAMSLHALPSFDSKLAVPGAERTCPKPASVSFVDTFPETVNSGPSLAFKYSFGHDSLLK